QDEGEAPAQVYRPSFTHSSDQGPDEDTTRRKHVMLAEILEFVTGDRSARGIRRVSASPRSLRAKHKERRRAVSVVWPPPRRHRLVWAPPCVWHWTAWAGSIGAGGKVGGLANAGCEKLKNSSIGLAWASRLVSVDKPNRSSMNRRIEVWSFTTFDTKWGLA